MTTEKVWESDWASTIWLILFSSVSREYLQTKLLYSWWSFVGLRNGAYSLALFCISLASFSTGYPVKKKDMLPTWAVIPRQMDVHPWKKWNGTPHKTNISHQWESETHLPNGPTGWDMLVLRRVGTLRTSLNKLPSSTLRVGPKYWRGQVDSRLVDPYK